jgi:hypothetical protein
VHDLEQALAQLLKEQPPANINQRQQMVGGRHTFGVFTRLYYDRHKPRTILCLPHGIIFANFPMVPII